jgi:hypothetical protein
LKNPLAKLLPFVLSKQAARQKHKQYWIYPKAHVNGFASK